ncbi:MAG: hypothetical protein ACLRNP_19395 [Blautia coccoides]
MKLTVIGGCGSRSLMLAKCLAQQAESLGITEVVFIDTDKERVRVFGSMVKEVFARTAPSVHYVCTADEKEAVREADYIITTIRAGKEESRIIDERGGAEAWGDWAGDNRSGRICHGPSFHPYFVALL